MQSPRQHDNCLHEIDNAMPKLAKPRFVQDKSKEIEFFNRYAGSDQYNVFTDETNERIVSACVRASGFKPGMLVADLGCGSGIFTRVLRKQGFKSFGLDITHSLLVAGRKADPEVDYVAGDVERLPFASGSLDGVMLSGLVHHLPDPVLCAAEVYRVLKAGGIFVAFDPNRRNPFMWLYRDWDSPFYSDVGVTENERPVIASEVAGVFCRAGFRVKTDYLSGLSYRYIASAKARLALPVYNWLDDVLFKPAFMRPCRAFVITSGVKT